MWDCTGSSFVRHFLTVSALIRYVRTSCIYIPETFILSRPRSWRCMTQLKVNVSARLHDTSRCLDFRLDEAMLTIKKVQGTRHYLRELEESSWPAARLEKSKTLLELQLVS